MVTRPRTTRGFTLAELLVAITITTLMLLLINQLFNSTSRAVTVGLKTADITMEAEIIGQQIHDDFERMLPPEDPNEGDGGYLVIVQHATSFDLDGDGVDGDGVEVMRRGRFAPDLNAPVEEDPYREPFIRSDQVIFIGDHDPELQSLTPRDDSEFGSQVTAPHTRVRYGHVRRVDSDLADIEDAALGDGPNRWANNWVLSRHETLMAGSENFFDTDDWPLPTPWHAQTAGWNSPVPNVMHSDAPDPVLLHHSITDVADQELELLLNELGTAPEYYDPLLHPDYEVAGDLRGPYGWTPPETLPLANPNPGLDGAPHAFDAWRIGQMHPVLSGHVSDFIVEFAGDYSGDDEIDRDSEGNIIWYAFDHADFTNPGVHPSGVHPYRPRVAAFPHEPSADGFDHEGNPSAGPDDTMYHLGPTELEGEYGGNFDRTAVFVWRHDDDSDEAWPWLVRIRYRLHDPQGHVQSPRFDEVGNRDEQPWLGQWFEHVIALPRATDGS